MIVLYMLQLKWRTGKGRWSGSGRCPEFRTLLLFKKISVQCRSCDLNEGKIAGVGELKVHELGKKEAE